VDTDVLIIGGGPGGTPAAMALAAAGRRVVLVEAGRGLGGVCLFEGCVPSKIFRESAARLLELRRAAEFGLRVPDGSPRIDWPAVQARRQAILQHRAEAALARARRLPTLEVLFGRAHLVGPRRAILDVRGDHREVIFTHAILATGSVPNRLPIPGADLPRVMSSEGLLDIGAVPERLVLIGGGPIGVEMAQIFHILGSRATILEVLPQILTGTDAVLAERLTSILRQSGIEVRTGVQVEAIDESEGAYRVRYRAADRADHVEADAVVMVTGRHPNVEGLGLEHTRVRHDQHGVRVDAHLETDEPGIFADGDLVGQPMFAHWATAQALALAQHLLGRPARFPQPEMNSAVIFSRPELAMAGLTEEAARAAGLPVAVAEYDYRTDARAQIQGETDGWLRVVYRTDSGRIVGVHALVEGAADLMGEAALAVASGLDVDAVASAIHPHPTLTEGFAVAAQQAAAEMALR
jgi:dihydrolipoamide dehydrogenase